LSDHGCDNVQVFHDSRRFGEVAAGRGVQNELRRLPGSHKRRAVDARCQSSSTAICRQSYLFSVKQCTTVGVQCESKKNPPPAVFLIFFPNGGDFLISFIHTYYTIISTLEYKFLADHTNGCTYATVFRLSVVCL